MTPRLTPAAGVFLSIRESLNSSTSRPRPGGGVSFKFVGAVAIKVSSPFTRGCFQLIQPAHGRAVVFPAHAGVVPATVRKSLAGPSCPCLHGGVSNFFDAFNKDPKSSPLTRGCFRLQDLPRNFRRSFPASAGVFPSTMTTLSGTLRLPRPRGGVSFYEYAFRATDGPSPLRRGCFHAARVRSSHSLVFPVCAGVFPTPTTTTKKGSCLPRLPRGCFSNRVRFSDDSEVFPAQAGVLLWIALAWATVSYLPRSHGVFHTSSPATGPTPSLPRTRGGHSNWITFWAEEASHSPHSGGISTRIDRNVKTGSSSPRMRGCFHVIHGH
jgi:hypothetical protein